MELIEQIKALIEQPLQEAGYTLDEVLYEKEGVAYFLRIVLDKPGAMTVEDCVVATKIVDPILDTVDPISDPYILDICSKEKGRE